MATSYRHFGEIPASFGQQATALSFDPVSDTLWVGTSSGHITSYYGSQALRGVSFRSGRLGVHKVVAGENYVRAMSASDKGIGTWAKGGMNKWMFNHECALTTFAGSPVSSDFVAVASTLSELLLLNPVTGLSQRQAFCDTTALITHLEFSHSLILSGASDGALRTHDPRTGMVRGTGTESVVKAHSSGFLGLQTSGNFVFTIGTSTGHSRSVADPLVMVYDLRNMKALSPVPFANPAFINVVPKRPSSIAITSEDGFVSIVDVANLNARPEFKQLDVTAYVTSVAISPTGAYLASGTTDGLIHLHTTVEDDDDMPPFNGFEGQPVEWTSAPSPLPGLKWTDSTPLNSIGLPFYDSPLLSSWSSSFTPTTVHFPPPQKIPFQIANSIQSKDSIAFAALPKELKGRRNVAPIPRKQAGRFRSRNQPAPEASRFEGDDDVPVMYRHVEIEYSKFGVEDFDFAFYNETEYSGLETHILYSYTNPVVQVMHYLLPIRALAKSHITINCPLEHCMLCELGFVARMLEDAHGTNCQASNLCKTLGVLTRRENWDILNDYGLKDIDHAGRIQQFHRVLIERLKSEGIFSPHNPVMVSGRETNAQDIPPPITQLLGIIRKNIFTCMQCDSTWVKEQVLHYVELELPRLKDSPDTNLSTMLRQALLRQNLHSTSCPFCRKAPVAVLNQREVATRDLPPILAINTGQKKTETTGIWLDSRRRKFLQPRIELHGQINGEEDPTIAVYLLSSMVIQVTEKDGHSHLVAIIKVPDADSHESPWYLFNDFVVRNISQKEALSFPGNWKVPTMLYYERTDPPPCIDQSGLPTQIDASILYQDTSISLNRYPAMVHHELLSPDELPTPGTLVAIDAEFVSMQQEEIEYRSDGLHKVLRPARLSLARVSVLRGNDPKQGVPFIDDHIHTSETIVDYLTEFSGIRYGDLDPMHSPHTLTPLKVVYKKLRLLVDRGCIFIGHGLSKDFRIINIFVPPEQVIDTVDLYFVQSRQRKLSLRFLSWFVLHENIQTDTHDSIEDARSALNLYKAALEFEAEGTFDQKLEELYKEGRQYNFKPPEAANVPLDPDMSMSPFAVGGMFPTHHSAPLMSMPMDNFTHLYPTSHSASQMPVSGVLSPFFSIPQSFHSTQRETHSPKHHRPRRNPRL